MIVTVNNIFVICWGTDIILHLEEQFSSYKLNPVVIPITYTILLFNSAVNLFAYALFCQQFREKTGLMIWCGLSSALLIVGAIRDEQDIEILAQSVGLRRNPQTDFDNLSSGNSFSFFQNGGQKCKLLT